MKSATVHELSESADIFAGSHAAKAANDHEQNMSMRYTVKYYYGALLWAILMAAPIIMEGYETALVPSFFSYSPFQQRYGRFVSEDTFMISPAWQSGITIAAACGQLLGLWTAPKVVNRIGYRTCTIAGLAWAGAFLMVGFWSSVVTQGKLPMFLCGELLLGIPWGLFQGITLPYASDITPLKLKGPATTMINIFWLIGQLVSAGVLRGASEMENQLWSIRLPMLIQYAWIVPLLLIVTMAPESPLFLSRTNQDEKAAKVLRRLNCDPVFDEQGAIEMIRAVNTHEKETAQTMGFTDCFRGINLRRTEITIIIYLTQQLVGSPLVFYSVNVLQKGGLSQSSSLYVTIGMYGLCIFSTLSSMAAMRVFGRRTLWLAGLATEILCLSAIGILAFFNDRYQAASWVIAVLLVIFAVVYNFTVGPVCYTIVAETPSTRLKAATNSISRGTYILFAIANLFLVPNLLEAKPAGWGLGARAALVWAGTSAVCLAWAFFRLPEMKDRTPAEIDVMFERKVDSRAWSDTTL